MKFNIFKYGNMDKPIGTLSEKGDFETIDKELRVMYDAILADGIDSIKGEMLGDGTLVDQIVHDDVRKEDVVEIARQIVRSGKYHIKIED